MTIIAIEKNIEEPQTGAILGYHRVQVYQVDVLAGVTTATLASYPSRTQADAGKRPVSHISVGGLPGVPEGDAVQWIYAQLLDPANAGEKNVLAGGTPVLAVAEEGE